MYLESQCFHATANYLSWWGSNSETSTPDSILIPHSSLETAFHLPLTKPLKPWRRGVSHHQRSSWSIHQVKQSSRESIAYLQLLATFLLTAWLIFLFVSHCHFFTLSLASLPAIFYGWARQWRKEGWGRKTERGRRLWSPGRALMKSLWSWMWLKSSRILRRRRGRRLSEDRLSFPFPFPSPSHHITSFLFWFSFFSLSQFHVRSSPPPSPCSYNRPSFHRRSSVLIRTRIMSLRN